MFLCAYVDILAFYKPGVVDDILVGVVWEFHITQTWAITALTLLAIPIFMVVLSMTLPARANRITNLIVASVQVPFAAFNAVGESWLYFYGLGIALELILSPSSCGTPGPGPAAPHRRRPWQPASTASHSARRSRRDCPPRARPSFARPHPRARSPVSAFTAEHSVDHAHDGGRSVPSWAARNQST